jgi:hypothetical protein
MNAAASSLIEAIKASYVGIDVSSYPYGSVVGATGTDWDSIPSGATSWFKYGSGGVGGWGSLCGVPNACIAVLNLMNKNGTSGIVDQIMYHYCQTLFPISLDDLYAAYPSSWAHQPVPDAEVLAHTISNSPLCHASVSKWAYAAGVSMTATDVYGSGHKTDRCAKVASAGAAFTAALINDIIASTAIPADYGMPALTAQCYSCHGYGTSAPGAPDNQGKMDCGECHTDNKPHRALSLVIEDVWTADGSGSSKNTFTGGDSIQYKVQFSILGSGSCFMKTYKSRAAGTDGKIQGLPKNETLSAGTYEWTWSGTVPGGSSGAAKVIMDLKMFDYQAGPLQAEAKKIHKFTII